MTSGLKTNFEPGSGCGKWGKGTRRMVPMGVVRVLLSCGFVILPNESISPAETTVFIEA